MVTVGKGLMYAMYEKVIFYRNIDIRTKKHSIIKAFSYFLSIFFT